MDLFKSKVKTPAECIKKAKETIAIFQKPHSSKTIEKARKEIAGYLNQMKEFLYGVPDKGIDPNPEHANQLVNAIFAEDFLALLLQNLHHYDFETRKDVVTIFNKILRKQNGNSYITVDYLMKRPDLISFLVRGYEFPEIALNCGSMLREVLHYEPLARIVLHSDDFYRFFNYMVQSNFDLTSDAFSSFKELMTRHKGIVAEFLEQNYDRVFECYGKLLKSDNYVTRRQSLKLLGELLLDRANFSIMTRYISNEENLKLMMIMLGDKKRTIQFEAFHVFKVFVANPNKPAPILAILVNNKEKLISFLSNFHNDKEDEQFNEEKAFLIKQISAL